MKQRWKYLQPLLLAAVTLLSVPASAEDALCWKQNYGRGAGTVAGSCAYGEEKDAGLCYPKCAAGYTGVGPVCYQKDCPSNMTDIGATCAKPPNITTAGYPWKIGDGGNLDAAKARCEKDWGVGRCYQEGAIIYPRCPAGYHNFGANICTADCPSGMLEGGLFCTKGSYGRGVGKIPSCGSGSVEDAGLCYPSCGNGFDGVGPVCWGTCPDTHPTPCGAACAQSPAACAVAVGDMALNTTSVALNLLSFGFANGGTSAFAAAKKSASSAAGKAIINSSARSTSSLAFARARAYAAAFAKQFIKTSLKNKVAGPNKYWTVAKLMNKGALKGMNVAASEFGVLHDSGTSDLMYLTMLDPTGISSMITSFTQYGSCSVDSFLLNAEEVDFGTFSGTQTRTVILTAQRKMTVTRVATPALANCSLSAASNCAGRELSPGQTCTITVTAAAPNAMDAELRIFTTEYSALPFAIPVKGNLNAPSACTEVPGVEEAINNSTAAGAWSLANTSEVFTIADGRLNAQGGAVSFVPAGDLGRAFRFGNTHTLTLDEPGQHLTGPIVAGPIKLPALGRTLDVFGANSIVGAPVVPHSDNGGLNQRFNFEMQPDGTYRIAALHSGLSLDVWWASKEPGAPVMQNHWHGGTNQKFRVEPVGGTDYFRIVSAHSDLVLQANGDDQPITQEKWIDSPGQRFGLVVQDGLTLIRRPWDAGCNAGETKVAGLCYKLPVGFAVTAPGFMGKICPYDWRDDGTSCWPAWTGLKVDGVADPDKEGTVGGRHPLVVTSCTNYSSAKGQSCPANFSHTAVCTCQPITKSKEVKSIIGRIP